MNAMKQEQKAYYRTKWAVRKYANQADYEAGRLMAEPEEIDGNILLNEGITALLTLLIGGGGTAFNNANAYIGVGDSSTAESAAHTGLQASSNKAYVAMSATYPQVSGQSVAFRSAFDGTTANFAWNEFTVANGNSDSATNLNRKVSSQGTKASGQVWTIDLTITLS